MNFEVSEVDITRQGGEGLATLALNARRFEQLGERIAALTPRKG